MAIFVKDLAVSFEKNLATLPLLVVFTSRDEHWTGLGLDWIGTLTNFVEFGLYPDCEMLRKSRIRTGIGLT